MITAENVGLPEKFVIRVVSTGYEYLVEREERGYRISDDDSNESCLYAFDDTRGWNDSYIEFILDAIEDGLWEIVGEVIDEPVIPATFSFTLNADGADPDLIHSATVEGDRVYVKWHQWHEAEGELWKSASLGEVKHWISSGGWVVEEDYVEDYVDNFAVRLAYYETHIAAVEERLTETIEDLASLREGLKNLKEDYATNE